MTATFVRQLPLTLGGALGSAIARLFAWGLERFMRAPFTYLGLILLTCLSAAAGSNALYHQTMRHPAPLFAAPEVPRAQGGGSQPVVLAPVRQEPAFEQTGSTQRAGEAAPASVDQVSGPTGNTDVFKVQQKLQAMKLFDGKVDGYYGPRTARAIRAFELARGMRPLGALTPEVVQAILRAPIQDLSGLTSGSVGDQPIQQVAFNAGTPVQDMPAPIDRSGAVAVAPAERPAGEVVTALAKAPQTELAAPQPIATRQSEELPPLALANVEVQRGSLGGAPEVAVSDGLDAATVTKIQRGLASLGFLSGAIDGAASDRTAKAIRNFEVFNNFPVTGQITPDLIPMLADAGASF